MDYAYVPERALILARESNDGESLVDSQEYRTRKLAAELGWTVGPATTHVIRENDTSAFKRTRKTYNEDGHLIMRTNRPNFRRARQMLDNGEADAVIADALDRITRDQYDFGDFAAVIRRPGRPIIPVATVARDLDMNTEQGVGQAWGRVLHANDSSVDTKRRVMQGKRRRAEEKGFSNIGGGRRAYGWERDNTINEREAREIRRMARIVLDGGSVGSVIRDLARRGVPTVTGNLKWDKSTIYGILAHPRTAGRSVYKGEDVGPLRKPDGSEAGGILTEEEMDKLSQRIGYYRYHGEKLGLRGARRKYIGSGIFECGVCGGAMAATGKAGGVYRCREGSHLSRNREAVDALVIAEITGVLAEPDAVRLLRSHTDTPDPDIASLEAELGKLQQQRDELLSLVKNGICTAAEVEQSFRENSKEQAKLKAEIKDLRHIGSSDDPLARIAGKKNARAIWDTKLDLELKREIIDSLVRVVILPAGRGRKLDGSFFDPADVRITWR